MVNLVIRERLFKKVDERNIYIYIHIEEREVVSELKFWHMDFPPYSKYIRRHLNLSVPNHVLIQLEQIYSVLVLFITYLFIYHNLFFKKFL